MPYFLALFERIPGAEDCYGPGGELQAHVQGLVKAGKLVFAGRLSEIYDGMGILHARDRNEAESIVARNPTVGRSTKVILLEIKHPLGTAFS